ncbi:MAG TPA: hypothetical protein VFM70_10805 [Salinimicrobium sp.]|nr:hypothetical protein [Salinimicrobium sp.]
MKSNQNLVNILNWLFGLIIFVIGIMNLVLVHPVPGIIYLFLSLLFLPPLNKLLKRRIGFAIPFSAKIILFLIIIWFTLGISDLAEIYGI